MRLTIVPAVLVSLLLAAGHASAATILIDDFTAGSNFTSINQNQTINFVGAGPIGGTREVRIATVFGANTTSLNTGGGGTLSIATTGFSDTYTRYGLYDLANGSGLNLALNPTASMDLVFSSFALGSGDAGGGNDGIFLTLLDGAGTQLSYSASGAEIAALAASNGGTLSVALSNFVNFGFYNGEIDGISFGIDDRDISAAVQQAQFAGVGDPVPEPGTLALVLGGALAVIVRRGSRRVAREL